MNKNTTFKLNHRLISIALAITGTTVNGIVVRHTSNVGEAIATAAYGGYDAVGRVYLTGDRKSTAPAAIISTNRALIFTTTPNSIESIEVGEEEKKKHKVIAIKEIMAFKGGFLICCEVEEGFNNITPFMINRDLNEARFSDHFTSRLYVPYCNYSLEVSAHNLKPNDYGFIKLRKASSQGESLTYAHPYQVSPLYFLYQTSEYRHKLKSYDTVQDPCERAVILGYGAHYDYITRKPISGENVDVLKAAEACVFERMSDQKQLFCPFDDEGIYKTKDGNHATQHSKMQGWVGPDDLWALLVSTKNTRSGQLILLGLASSAGSKDILNPKKPFYNRLSTFLRLSSIYRTHDLGNIATTHMPRGYTTISGQTTPLSPTVPTPSPAPQIPPALTTPEPLPSSRRQLFFPQAQHSTVNIGGLGFGAARMIENSCILIQPNVILTSHPADCFGKQIIVRGAYYNVKEISDLGDLRLTYLTTPIRRLSTGELVEGISIFRGSDPFGNPPMGTQALSLENLYILNPINEHDHTTKRYLIGFQDFPTRDIQLTLEQRTKIDSDIITDALEVNK